MDDREGRTFLVISQANEKKISAPTLVGKVRPRMFTVDAELDQHEQAHHAGAGAASPLDVLVREGAQRMLAAALQAEVRQILTDAVRASNPDGLVDALASSFGGPRWRGRRRAGAAVA